MGDTTTAAPAPAPVRRFGRICVFCGSNSGNRAVFGDAALALGQGLVTRGVDLVYGGGSIGLMGLIAQTVLDGGCRVHGVIPRALMPLESKKFLPRSEVAARLSSLPKAKFATEFRSTC